MIMFIFISMSMSMFIIPFMLILFLFLLLSTSCPLFFSPALVTNRLCQFHVYLPTLHEPSLNSKTLFSCTSIQYLPCLPSCSQSCSPSPYQPYAFDPVVRHRRYTNASATHLCVQHLSTPLPYRYANGCLLPPYGSHLL